MVRSRPNCAVLNGYVQTGVVTFHLPNALADPRDNTAALELLCLYYGEVFCGPGAATGAAFDLWDSSDGRADWDRFTAHDLVAVTFLSVDVPAPAARLLLRDRADEFSALLVEVGPDRDLVDELEPFADDSAEWRLMNQLRGLPRVGNTTASKLLARKRPRLRPIWDQVVAEVTGTHQNQWEPLRTALRDDDKALHRRLVRLRDEAGLPAGISPLRVFDVICWREGKNRGF